MDLDWVRFVQPVLAACLPLLAWAAFLSLRDERLSVWHGLWPLGVLACWLMVPEAVDPLIIVEFALYGLLLLRLRFPGDVLTRVRIGEEWKVAYARNGIAALLLLSAVVDTTVSLALIKGDGPVAAQMIAAMMGVIFVGLAGDLLARTVAAIPNEIAPPQRVPETGIETTEETAILAAVDAVLAQGLYRDYDLTLQRIARKTRITARKISEAVNHVKGCSVTDLVNGYRVAEAMRLLRNSDMPITQVMLEIGFQSKSNFNRAFKALAGQTPTAYRAAKTE